MATADQFVQKLMKLDGSVACMLVDANSGMVLASESNHFDTEVAAGGNTRIVQAMRDTMQMMDVDDRIDDMLITLDKQYHLIRPVKEDLSLFAYFVMSRDGVNLAMARTVLKKELDTVVI